MLSGGVGEGRFPFLRGPGGEIGEDASGLGDPLETDLPRVPVEAEGGVGALDE